jgi:hypothetical protein
MSQKRNGKMVRNHTPTVLFLFLTIFIHIVVISIAAVWEVLDSNHCSETGYPD